MKKSDYAAMAHSRIVWMGIAAAGLAVLAPMMADDPDLPRWAFKMVNYSNAVLAAVMVAIRGSDKVRDHRREVTGVHKAME